MSTDHLDEQLIDGLAPDDAPTDDEIRGYIDALSDTDEDVREHAEKRPPPFEVRDLASADWAGRKIRQAQSKIDEARDYRAKVIAELDAHVAREEARHTPTIEFFEHHLTQWLRRELEADPKGKKSRDLPCGLTVKRTAGKPSLVVEDEEALVEWLRDGHPDLVEFVPKYDKGDLKKAFLETGEAMKGARVETGEDSYKVTGGDR